MLIPFIQFGKYILFLCFRPHFTPVCLCCKVFHLIYGKITDKRTDKENRQREQTNEQTDKQTKNKQRKFN